MIVFTSFVSENRDPLNMKKICGMISESDTNSLVPSSPASEQCPMLTPSTLVPFRLRSVELPAKFRDHIIILISGSLLSYCTIFASAQTHAPWRKTPAMTAWKRRQDTLYWWDAGVAGSPTHFAVTTATVASRPWLPEKSSFIPNYLGFNFTVPSF